MVLVFSVFLFIPLHACYFFLLPFYIFDRWHIKWTAFPYNHHQSHPQCRTATLPARRWNPCNDSAQETPPTRSPNIDLPPSASSRHFRPVFNCWQHIQHCVHASFNPGGGCITDYSTLCWGDLPGMGGKRRWYCHSGHFDSGAVPNLFHLVVSVVPT